VGEAAARLSLGLVRRPAGYRSRPGVWATDRFGTALFSDGEDDRMDVECDEFTLIGPVVWIQPKGYPPR
jgi:hypothetical protein